MKYKFALIVFVFNNFIFNPILFAQDAQKMSKSELRDQVFYLKYEIDSIILMYKALQVSKNILEAKLSIAEQKNKNFEFEISGLNKMIFDIENENKENVTFKDNEIARMKLVVDSLTDAKAITSNYQPVINVFEKSDLGTFFVGYYDEKHDFIFKPNDFRCPASNNLNGEFISYYSQRLADNYSKDGERLIYARGSYKEGFKDGYWVYRLCDGSIRDEGYFYKGLKVGKWTNYDFSNSLIDYQLNKMNFPTLLTLLNYYNIKIGELREVVYFNAGVPSDTCYYFDLSNNMKIKIAWKTGEIFYDNNQPFVNQKCDIHDPFLVGIENENLLEVFNREGKVRYRFIKNKSKIIEEYFNDDGILNMYASYIDGYGSVINYDINGFIIGESEDVFGTGKYEPESPCQ